MRFKLIIPGFLFAFISFLSLGGTPSLTLEDLAKIFSTYFPKIEGQLSRVEGTSGTINLGEKEGLVKGMVLMVYRLGEPFYHPITREPMGVYEDDLGFLEVETVGVNESQGSLTLSGGKAGQADKVRISGARIPVSVTGEPEKNNLVVMDEFSRFLLETGRFSIPSFSKIKTGTPLKNEPVYEFKVHSFPDQSVQIELYNRPFHHLIDRLTGTVGKLQE